MVVAVVLFGRASTWKWVESQWRLDIGAPPTTAPYPTDIGDPVTRIAAAGDVGTGGAAQYETFAAMDRLDRVREFDAVLLLGDNIYPSGDPSSLQSKLLDPLRPVLDGPTELVAALGNHDVQTGDGVPLIDALDLPGRWYDHDIGTVRVVVVDSTRACDPAQVEWVRTTLGRVDAAEWTIVMQHHPPFSAGYHGSHRPSGECLVPLYERFGVDLVLAGHDHDYQRSTPQNGVTYVVSGGAAKLRPTASASFTAAAASTYHFTELAVYADRLVVRAVDHDGRILDDFSLAPG